MTALHKIRSGLLITQIKNKITAIVNAEFICVI